MVDVSYSAAFVAGLLSFLSPCILPVVPGYLSFLSGVSLNDMQEGSPRVILNAVAFTCGFSLIFILLGASATTVGGFLLSKISVLTKVSGVLVALLGLHLMGLTPIKWLYVERRAQFTQKPVGLLGSVLVGMAFAFGWTPCIGPILAAILTYAGTRQSVWQGIALLSAYSAGLGIPFILTGVLAKPALAFLNRLKARMRAVEISAGALLVVLGILIYTNQFSRLAQLPWFAIH